MISQKVSSWEEKSRRGAASLGKDIRALVLSFSKSLATGDSTKEEENHQPPQSQHNSYAEAARTLPRAPKIVSNCQGTLALIGSFSGVSRDCLDGEGD